MKLATTAAKATRIAPPEKAAPAAVVEPAALEGAAPEGMTNTHSRHRRPRHSPGWAKEAAGRPVFPRIRARREVEAATVRPESARGLPALAHPGYRFNGREARHGDEGGAFPLRGGAVGPEEVEGAGPRAAELPGGHVAAGRERHRSQGRAQGVDR